MHSYIRYVVTDNKENGDAPNNEKANLKPTKESSVTSQTSSISKENVPSISKILITDDGKDESNTVFNYAVSLSKYSGAELQILRILDKVEKIEGASVEGVSVEGSNTNIKQEVKGQVIDEMESKVKRCREAGCDNKISYKFKVGNPLEEIVKETKAGNYDLLVLRSVHLDSGVRALFSSARKIIGNVDIPVLIVH
ncbi:MAG: universal stress protein [Thaumarchaeota archaeon]|nr:MAG: universal stress protein [Nitrososphaerota archaeon]